MTLPTHYSPVINNSQRCQLSVRPSLSRPSDQTLREGPEGPVLIPMSHLGLTVSGKKTPSLLRAGSREISAAAQSQTLIWGHMFIFQGETPGPSLPQ